MSIDVLVYHSFIVVERDVEIPVSEQSTVEINTSTHRTNIYIPIIGALVQRARTEFSYWGRRGGGGANLSLSPP